MVAAQLYETAAPAPGDPAAAHVGAVWTDLRTSRERRLFGGRLGGPNADPWAGFTTNLPVSAEAGDDYFSAAVQLSQNYSHFAIARVLGTPGRNGYPTHGATTNIDLVGIGGVNFVNTGLSLFPAHEAVVSSLSTEPSGALDWVLLGGWQRRLSIWGPMEVALPSTVGFIWPWSVDAMASLRFSPPLWFGCDDRSPVYVRAAIASFGEYVALLSAACSEASFTQVQEDGGFQLSDGGYAGPRVALRPGGRQSYVVRGSYLSGAPPLAVTPVGAADPFAGGLAVDRDRDAIWVALSLNDGGVAVHRLALDAGVVLASVGWATDARDRLDAIAVDSSGDAFAVGVAHGPFTAAGASYTPRGGSDALAIRVRVDGGLHSVALFGGPAEERFQAVTTAVGTARRVLIGGTYDGGFDVLDASVPAPPAESLMMLEFAP